MIWEVVFWGGISVLLGFHMFFFATKKTRNRKLHKNPKRNCLDFLSFSMMIMFVGWLISCFYS